MDSSSGSGRSNNKNSGLLVGSFKCDIYDLDEPPHTYSSSPSTIVSYGGMVLKKEVAAYLSLLFKLKLGDNMSPDVRYYLSKHATNLTGRITVKSKDRGVEYYYDYHCSNDDGLLEYEKQKSEDFYGQDNLEQSSEDKEEKDSLCD